MCYPLHQMRDRSERSNSRLQSFPCFVTGSLAPDLRLYGSRQHSENAVSRIRMGRRSDKIKNRKESQTRTRTKDFARIGKMIAIAAKAGGPDIVTNKALADALDAAKAVSFPKETIEKTIAKATSTDPVDYKESSFEIYGHGGAGIFVDVLTDNANRAAADIRTIVSKQKMKIGDPGSVAFNFARVGVVRILAENVTDPDELLMAAIDAGAEECELDPLNQEQFRILVPVGSLQQTRRALLEAGYSIECFGPEMIPKMLLEISEADAEKNYVAIEQLEDLDDVDAVATNMKCGHE